MRNYELQMKLKFNAVITSVRKRLGTFFATQSELDGNLKRRRREKIIFFITDTKRETNFHQFSHRAKLFPPKCSLSDCSRGIIKARVKMPHCSNYVQAYLICGVFSRGVK